MKQSIFNLSAVRRPLAPLMRTSQTLSAQLIEQSDQLSLSRRRLLGLAGAAGVTASPALRAITQTAAGDLELRSTQERVAFVLGGVERWVIDTRDFGGQALLRRRREGTTEIVELRDARFPGTSLTADLHCAIKPAIMGHRMRLRFALGGFDAELPLEQWLLGIVPARSGMTLDHRGPQGSGLDLQGQAQAEYRPDWQFSLRAPSIVRCEAWEASLDADQLLFGLAEPDFPSLLKNAPRSRTLFRFRREGQDWRSRPFARPQNTWDLQVPDNAFDAACIETAENHKGRQQGALLLATDDETAGIAIQPAGGIAGSRELPLRLPLRQVRVLRSFGRGKIHESLSARFAAEAVWHHIDACSLELGDTPATPPFEMHARDGRLRQVVCEPAFLRLGTPLANALVSPSAMAPGTHLLIAAAPQRGGRRKATQQAPQRQAGQGQLQIDAKKLTGKLILPESFSVSIIRPDDLVVLRFEFFNFELNTAAGQLRHKDSAKTSYLVVHFQPQNIAERAFYETANTSDDSEPGASDEKPGAPPIQARISGPSRLAFVVPKSKGTIDYSLEGLLDWSEYSLSVAPTALPPPVVRLLSKISSLAADSKTILSAGGGAKRAEIGSVRSRRQNNRTLGRVGDAPPKSKRTQGPTKQLTPQVRAQLPPALGDDLDNNQGVMSFLAKDVIKDLGIIQIKPQIAEPGNKQTALEIPYRLIISPNKYGSWAHKLLPVINPLNGRAELWHTRLGVRRQDGSTDEANDYLRTIRAIWSPDWHKTAPPSAVDKWPFRMSLDRRDRYELVALSSDFYRPDYTPVPVDVKRLMLSSLGAWVNVLGNFDPPMGNGQPTDVSVEQWKHRGTQGRDHYVRVMYAGYLFPLGQRATLVKITERKFARTPRGDMAAYMFQKMYIMVRQPVKVIPAGGLQGSDNANRDLPLRRIEITTLVTPPIDQPEDSDIDNKGREAFWPKLNTKDFSWHIRAKDWAGDDLEFEMPLLFVSQAYANSADFLANKIAPAYSAATFPGGAHKNEVAMQGQLVSMAPAAKAGDTALEANTLTFDVNVPAQAVQLAKNQPRFFPRMAVSAIRHAEIEELTGNAGGANVAYDDGYLEHGFDGDQNKGEIFVKLVNAISLNFGSSTDKSGGLAAPTMAVHGLSRMMGPVSGEPNDPNAPTGDANLTELASGKFDPEKIFADVLNAKLFGSIKLKDILQVVFNILSNLDEVPKLASALSYGLMDEYSDNLSNAAKNAIKDRLNQMQSEVLDFVASDIPLQTIKDLKNEAQSAVNTAKSKIDALAGASDSAKKTLQEEIKQALKAAEKNVNEINQSAAEKVKELRSMGNEALQKYEQLTNTLDLLKKGLCVGYDWETPVKSTSGGALGDLFISHEAKLSLSAQLCKSLDYSDPAAVASPPVFTLRGSLTNFEINLVEPIIALLSIRFNYISFYSKNGSKPDVKTDISTISFKGPLSFVDRLQELIPRGGFGSLPQIDLQPTGIKASYSLPIPSIAVGVLNIQNISLNVAVALPFTGDPLSFYFSFCTRDSPFRLTVSMFGGGGFFGLEVTPDGLRLLEAAFEFGAAIALDIGVASGGVSVMAGLYYKYEEGESTLTGYIDIQGHLRILGLIRLSVKFYLSLTWQSNGKVWGQATVTVEIEVLFFSASVSMTVERQFKGSNGDPLVSELLLEDNDRPGQSRMWDSYCEAFA